VADQTPALQVFRILVIDDEEDAAQTLARLLVKMGHAAHCQTDSTKALALIRGYAPQIAFLDLGMPTLDGYGLATRIRAAELPVQPYLVALTGYTRDADRRKASKAGFDKYVTKPLDPAMLQAVLQEAGGASAAKG
jgi:CheY-like chemotaxis protein